MSESKIDLRSDRLLSLDVYRGLVMFTLFASGFSLAKVAESYPDSEVMQWLKFNNSHPQWSSQFKWVGFSAWDMIQPAFMFMVGVSMPYSYGKRKELGHSYIRRTGHAWSRAVILVLLGVFLASMRKPETNWLFTNVLGQIGLGYGFLYFFVGVRRAIQLIAGIVILVGYFCWMLPQGFDNGSSMPQEFDLWLLNQFPRPNKFEGHAYATLNFVPSMVTMLIGVICGELLKDSDSDARRKLLSLMLGGSVCLVLALAWSPWCPIVKKLWTPSWTLFSGAYVVWMLALLYWIVDCRGWTWGWTKFFVVVGMNSIAAYMMGQLMKPFVRGVFHTHIPNKYWEKVGVWAPCVESCLVAATFWLILFLMYRRRLFLRI